MKIKKKFIDLIIVLLLALVVGMGVACVDLGGGSPGGASSGAEGSGK